MTAGKPSPPQREFQTLKQVTEAFAASHDEIFDMEVWFASWLHPHVDCGEQAGRSWLVSISRLPLHLALHRSVRDYVMSLVLADGPAAERAIRR